MPNSTVTAVSSAQQIISLHLETRIACQAFCQQLFGSTSWSKLQRSKLSIANHWSSSGVEAIDGYKSAIERLYLPGEILAALLLCCSIRTLPNFREVFPVKCVKTPISICGSLGTCSNVLQKQGRLLLSQWQEVRFVPFVKKTRGIETERLMLLSGHPWFMRKSWSFQLRL